MNQYILIISQPGSPSVRLKVTATQTQLFSTLPDIKLLYDGWPAPTILVGELCNRLEVSRITYDKLELTAIYSGGVDGVLVFEKDTCRLYSEQTPTG